MRKTEIVNIVASTKLGPSFDLEMIAMSIEHTEYNCKTFPGLIYRIKEPKTAVLLFKSGKANCTGARTIGDVYTALTHVTNKLAGIGVEAYEKPEVDIQNIVATCDLGTKLKINMIAISLGLENVEYEPEVFPGMVYRIDDPKTVALLFSSGKLVLTGAKCIEDVDRAVNKLEEVLTRIGVLRG